MFPALRHVGFYVGGFDNVTNMVVVPLIMFGTKIMTWVKPRTWGRLLCWSHRTFNCPPYGTCVQLDAEGLRDGKRVNMKVDLFHRDEYELTAIPMVAVIEQVFDGTANKPGVHHMGILAHPDRLLADMKEMGVEIQERTVEI